MAQGRGSAVHAATALGLVLLCLLLHGKVVESAVYTVGDSSGWTFNAGSWANGKRFRAGDVLVFKYNPAVHNVVAVGGAGYNRCITPGGARIYKSGNDRVTLARGRNFFICNFSGHCESGMKIAVTAA